MRKYVYDVDVMNNDYIKYSEKNETSELLEILYNFLNFATLM